MSAHRKPTKPTTAAGVPIPADPILKSDVPPAKPNPLFVYAKAVMAFIVTEAAAVGTWEATLPAGPISRNAWIGLGIALASGLASAFGVAVTTNAQPADPEAGHSSVGVMLFVVILLAALLLGGFGSHWFFLLILLALLALFL